MTDTNLPVSKQCAYCQQYKPLSEFRRRTGKRSKGQSRRGACRDCRKIRGGTPASGLPEKPAPAVSAASAAAKKSAPAGHASAGAAVRQAAEAVSASRAAQHPASAVRQTAKAAPGGGAVQHGPKTAQPKTQPHSRPRPRAGEQRRKPPVTGWPKPDPEDYSALIPSYKGMILMRGHSDKGRRWHQEIDLKLAVTLVREHAAVVVNRRTIRRLYSNKDFRRLILTRDNYTCYFCGLYGDTIDHLLPRAKGGHTTPDNCVCACNLCNQTKADKDVEEFMRR
ncbi:HNH endonuclease [Paenibacillus sp. FSL R7-0273]|uniref:HNH endonuclease n=1 Tax=Paenibacillus sp. FSL R7-0273 TaxID=1536772 RepID=UPI00063F2FF7|nr:HNH endonuclease [Paenibacillus sp. FSL R7-0273]OMF93327.1 restriction endonuclease [Paenibacillus sp. FSL R7-0273]